MPALSSLPLLLSIEATFRNKRTILPIGYIGGRLYFQRCGHTLCVILLPRGEKYESHKDPVKTGDDDRWDRNDRYKLASKCINVQPEMGFAAALTLRSPSL